MEFQSSAWCENRFYKHRRFHFILCMKHTFPNSKQNLNTFSHFLPSRLVDKVEKAHRLSVMKFEVKWNLMEPTIFSYLNKEKGGCEQEYFTILPSTMLVHGACIFIVKKIGLENTLKMDWDWLVKLSETIAILRWKWKRRGRKGRIPSLWKNRLLLKIDR